VFGHQMLNATYSALVSIFPNKRPFFIGRSTFAGSGALSGHWGGDNTSNWGSMYLAISQALQFAIAGISMFGPDTCGFDQNTDYELCARWMAMDAFMPFYRNHNIKNATAQEAFRWSSVAAASRNAMEIRYSLLPYMYTLFYQAHTTGATVLRALQWEFPNEEYLRGVGNQFMLGPAILITPVLEPQVTTVKGVFPGVAAGTIWYDWYTLKKMDVAPQENKTLQAPLEHINVHVRGGSILPLQQPGYTTTESRLNPFGLVVALDGDGYAEGSLYLDDGYSLVPNATKVVEVS
jgi:alpha-glucosidase